MLYCWVVVLQQGDGPTRDCWLTHAVQRIGDSRLLSVLKPDVLGDEGQESS